MVQDCDDDGESAAGGRLLHLLQVHTYYVVNMCRALVCMLPVCVCVCLCTCVCTCCLTLLLYSLA